AGSSFLNFYRVVNREMVKPEWERMLQTAIIPPGIGHIYVLLSTAFESNLDLLRFAACTASLPLDFLVKTFVVGHIRHYLLNQLPMVAGTNALFVRTLLLNCVTNHYAALWRDVWTDDFTKQQWAKADCRLSNSRFSHLLHEWSEGTPLRTDFERRQGLIEIDV